MCLYRKTLTFYRVSRDFEVKISDASFSYDMYPDEYLENNGRYQPVRWMAPESLRQGFYDSKSDVVSSLPQNL